MVDWKIVAEILASALKLVAQVVAEKGNAETKAALVQLGAIMAALDSGDISGIDPATARAELDKLVDTLLEDRAEADVALAKRFDIEGDGL